MLIRKIIALPAILIIASIAISGCDAKVCQPFGTWEVSYSGEGTCKPKPDTLYLEDTGDGTIIKFTNLNVPISSCTAPDTPMPSYLVDGALTGNRCSLNARIARTWCTSGENQCDTRELTLEFDEEDSATGVLKYTECWCDGDPSGKTVEYQATAVRKSN